jgi:ubiquinone/menaquinone biosynthesis C-methylase UbiE
MQADRSDDIYRQQTAELYDTISTGLDGDVAFYVEEAQKAGSPVLELGCGTGRILIPIAEAGVEIVGLDAAPSMLAIAERKVAALPEEARKRIRLVEGDMRRFDLGKRFPLVLIPFRAFLHMMTVEDQKQALARIHAHLNEGGRLVLNMFDPRLEAIAAHSGPFGTAIKKLKEFTHPQTGNRVILWDSRQYDCERQILTEDRILEELDDSGTVVSRRYATLTLRFVYRYEMQHLLELCSFEVESLYGDFRRGPFYYGGEQVWIARRRD